MLCYNGYCRQPCLKEEKIQGKTVLCPENYTCRKLTANNLSVCVPQVRFANGPFGLLALEMIILVLVPALLLFLIVVAFLAFGRDHKRYSSWRLHPPADFDEEPSPERPNHHVIVMEESEDRPMNDSSQVLVE